MRIRGDRRRTPLQSAPGRPGRYITPDLRPRPVPPPSSDTPAFRANNELALHVPDPAAAEAFYVGTLGCVVTSRTPDCISLASGALRLYLLRDPARTHDAVVPSFDVPEH